MRLSNVLSYLGYPDSEVLGYLSTITGVFNLSGDLMSQVEDTLDLQRFMHSSDPRPDTPAPLCGCCEAAVDTSLDRHWQLRPNK